MTTLLDQLTVRRSTTLTDAERAERGIVAETVLSARVGRSGTERHAVHVTVWEATAERPHPMAGQSIGGRIMPATIAAQPRRWAGSRTYCGSQRFGSGAHSYSDSAPVTCERCLGRGWTLITESLPLDVLEPDPRTYFRPR